MLKEKEHLVIFDMNGVLMSKHKQISKYFEEKAIRINHPYPLVFHPNVDLKILGEFYFSHSFYLGIWTTGMLKNVDRPIKEIGEIMKINFDCILTQEDCSVGEICGNIKTVNCIKDLNKPSQNLNLELDKIILIDDSEGKRCGDQNFFCFDSFENGMLKAIKAIDLFIGCKDENCIAKKL